ncbi:dienelactone hydrolase family protein [Sphingobium bisphenolivorans]|uniref:dienelactone hydrolase family protein n=1 Tax=Sphingobium bisphenolivorans TaxID=1335760 RepID=UPI000489F9BC|nr:DeoR family transcriptional regulator [Sphingobium bisphenolivorans]
MTQQLVNRQDVPIGRHHLRGFLDVPENATGLVIFAHGSGSGRYSPRNQYVAAGLHRSRLATLLVDLLTPQEEMDRRNVFDVRLLARRLREAADWADTVEPLAKLPLGYFGASTGAAAAIIAASAPDDRSAAIVSRGGRPDLAGADALGRVRAPTLLIVGSLDHDVLGLNHDAKSLMMAPTELVVVPGASHLFEEPGTLDQVIGLAEHWFRSHLKGETQ